MSAQNGHEQQAPEKGPISLDEAQEILPWYLTGKTSRAETQAIDNLLRESADLRAQLEAAREQRQAVLDSTAEIAGPSAANLTRLLQQIETTKQRRLVAAEKPGFFGRLFGAPRPFMQFAFATACVLVVAQGALLYRADLLPFLAPGQSGSTYQTASSDVTGAAQTSGAELLVAFRPEVTTAQFTQILTELNAIVVDGPKPGLTFVLRLQATQDADEAIARLQSRPDLIATVQRR